MENNLELLIIIAIIAQTLALFWSYKIRTEQKKKIDEILKLKEQLEKEKEIISNEKSISENIVAEKSFKFIAINQMSKTLAKEKNVKNLKRLILDMLLETNSVATGFSMENKNNRLEIFETKGISKNDIDVVIGKFENSHIWEFMRQNKVISYKKLLEYKEFEFITSKFKDGYLLSFVISVGNEGVEEEDINFLVYLGEKSYGEYSDDEDEFLDTLCGQIEIVLENAIKNDFIKSQNDELTEKVYNLTILNYASKMISSTLDINELFEKSIDMIAEASRAEKTVMIYFDKENNEIEVKGVRGNVAKDLIGLKEKIDSKDIATISTISNIVILTEANENDLYKLSDFYKKYSHIFSYFKHEIYIPLLNKDELLGMILLGMKFEEGYKKDNIDVYATLASQISISLYNAKLYNLAITDGMTKLYLHRYFKNRLIEEIERAKRYERKISILMTDIDHFKKFNDTYGHQTGDEVLKTVASILKDSVRKSDVAARYGGEEFAVILPETGEEGAVIVAENIRRKIENTELKYEDKVLKITISIGVYTFDGADKILREDTVDECIKKADKALYYSKENGRNRVTHFIKIKGE